MESNTKQQEQDESLEGAKTLTRAAIKALMRIGKVAYWLTILFMIKAFIVLCDEFETHEGRATASAIGTGFVVVINGLLVVAAVLVLSALARTLFYPESKAGYQGFSESFLEGMKQVLNRVPEPKAKPHSKKNLK